MRKIVANAIGISSQEVSSEVKTSLYAIFAGMETFILEDELSNEEMNLVLDNMQPAFFRFSRERKKGGSLYNRFYENNSVASRNWWKLVERILTLPSAPMLLPSTAGYTKRLPLSNKLPEVFVSRRLGIEDTQMMPIS